MTQLSLMALWLQLAEEKKKLIKPAFSTITAVSLFPTLDFPKNMVSTFCFKGKSFLCG